MKPNEQLISLGNIISKKEFNKTYLENGYTLVKGTVKYNKRMKLNTAEDISALLKYNEGKKYPYPVYCNKGLMYIGNNEFITVKKINLLLPILLIFLLLILGINMFQGLDRNGPNLDPNLEDYEGNLVRPEEVSDAQTLVPGFPDFYMDANQNKLYVELVNPADNPCYFQYTILIKETGEVLYSSQLIPPGKTINKISLSRNIPKGEYNLIIRLNTYLLSNPELQLNGSDILTKLYALE